MKKKTQIFLVDDHPLICKGLEQLINLEDDLQVIGYAVNAETAMQAIRTLKPDLVIVDISLEGKSGIELIRDIKVSFPEVLILVLSMHIDLLFVDRALKAGAMGYISKNEATTVIVQAIRKVLEGTIYLNKDMSEKLMNSIYGKHNRSTRMLVDRLTPREFEVFRLIGQGLSNRHIAETLHISIKTVDSHKEHIKEKLHLKNAHELYRYAFQWLNLSE